MTAAKTPPKPRGWRDFAHVSLKRSLILSGAGLSNSQVGLAATIPFATAGIGAVIWGWHSDRKKERHWHTLSAMLLAGLSLSIVPLLGPSIWSLACSKSIPVPASHCPRAGGGAKRTRRGFATAVPVSGSSRANGPIPTGPMPMPRRISCGWPGRSRGGARL